MASSSSGRPLTRRTALLGLGTVVAAPALAANFPTKPIQFIVPFGAGGTSDIMARIVAESMTQRLGQQVVVENRPGASSMIGAEFVARAAKDGYTLLYAGTSTLSINPHYFRKLPYRNDDFQPVTGLLRGPNNLVVGKNVPAKDLPSFVDWVRKQNEPVPYACTGVASHQRIEMERFQIETGIRMVPVVYRGEALAGQDLAGGHVDVYFGSPQPVLPLHQKGLARFIGTTNDKRLPMLPDVPTFAESGYPQMTAYWWHGLVMPAGVPRPVLDTIHAAVLEAMRRPDLAPRLPAEATLFPTSPEEFGTFIDEETRRLGEVMRTRNIVE